MAPSRMAAAISTMRSFPASCRPTNRARLRAKSSATAPKAGVR